MHLKIGSRDWAELYQTWLNWSKQDHGCAYVPSLGRAISHDIKDDKDNKYIKYIKYIKHTK